jgi:hypothetical protein
MNLAVCLADDAAGRFPDRAATTPRRVADHEALQHVVDLRQGTSIETVASPLTEIERLTSARPLLDSVIDRTPSAAIEERIDTHDISTARKTMLDFTE